MVFHLPHSLLLLRYLTAPAVPGYWRNYGQGLAWASAYLIVIYQSKKSACMQLTKIVSADFSGALV